MRGARSLLGMPNPRKEIRGQSHGGMLPSIRPHYHPHVARALAALAESRPDPATYAREKARILEANR